MKKFHIVCLNVDIVHEEKYMKFVIKTNFIGKYFADGLAFWLETIRCHCEVPVEEECYNEYQEPPVIIVGTHKDQFTVISIQFPCFNMILF